MVDRKSPTHAEPAKRPASPARLFIAKTCGNCSHRWQPDPDKPELFCRRYPPKRGVDGRCAYPAVLSDWLCGEFRV